MNDQRIFECIAAAEGSLSVSELARQMEVDVDDARGQLAALLAVGDIIIVRGEYDFSERFKRGEVHAQLMKRAAAVQFAAKEKHGQLEDIAVMFLITRGGRCSASEMHLALNLKPHELASRELREALRTGKLFKEGPVWMLDRRSVPRNDPSADLEEDLAAVGSSARDRSPVAPVEESKKAMLRTEVATIQPDSDAPVTLNIPVLAQLDSLPASMQHLCIAGHRQNGLRLQRGTGEALILSSEETRRLRNFLVQHPEKAL